MFSLRDGSRQTLLCARDAATRARWAAAVAALEARSNRALDECETATPVLKPMAVASAAAAVTAATAATAVNAIGGKAEHDPHAAVAALNLGPATLAASATAVASTIHPAAIVDVGVPPPILIGDRRAIGDSVPERMRAMYGPCHAHGCVVCAVLVSLSRALPLFLSSFPIDSPH